MPEPSSDPFQRWLDIVAKLVTVVGIPLVGFVLQTRLQEQTAQFDRALKSGQMNVDLAVKFYDVINSKRFECFVENDYVLLDVFLTQYNRFSDPKIPKADIFNALAGQNGRNPSCAEAVRRVITAAAVAPESPALPQIGATRSLPVQNAPSPAPPPVSRAQSSSSGWVAVGRYGGPAVGFTNFAVLLSDTGKIDNRGSIAPGAILRARWAVYLRSNNQDTSQPGNPALGLLPEGVCVTVRESAPDLRGQTWASVSPPGPCPDADYR